MCHQFLNKTTGTPKSIPGFWGSRLSLRITPAAAATVVAAVAVTVVGVAAAAAAAAATATDVKVVIVIQIKNRLKLFFPSIFQKLFKHQG